MIPAALFATLAIGRLGAVHSIIFGGFASASLAKRIESARPRAIMTASCGIEGNKGPISYKPLVEGAVELSSWKPERVIIWQREETQWRPINRIDGGQRTWQKLVASAKQRGVKADPVPVKSNEAIYTIYTSGGYTNWTPHEKYCSHSDAPPSWQVRLVHRRELLERPVAMLLASASVSVTCVILTAPVM